MQESAERMRIKEEEEEEKSHATILFAKATYRLLFAAVPSSEQNHSFYARISHMYKGVIEERCQDVMKEKLETTHVHQRRAIISC